MAYKLKRSVALLLTFLMCFMALPSLTFAAEQPTLSVNASSTSMNVGDQVSVSVNISDNPGFASAGIDLIYDDSILEVSSMTSSFGMMTNPNYAPNAVRAVYANFVDNTNNGELFTVTFNAIAPGTANLSVAVNKLNNASSQPLNPVAGSTQVVVNAPVQSYEVSFDNRGYGTQPATQTIQDGECVQNPGDLHYEDDNYMYTFLGWYTDEQTESLYNFSTPVHNSFTLHAGWGIVPIERYYQLSFDAQGICDNPASVMISTATFPELPTVSADNYEFEGWYMEPDCITPFSREVSITADTTLYAKWTKINASYTVSHQLQDIDDTSVYNEDTTETLSGRIGQSTEAVAKEYTGFHAKEIVQQTIAEDDSTAVVVYYDRDTFNVTWQNYDNTELEKDTVLFGQTPEFNGETPSHPAEDGKEFIFAGWSPEVVPANGDAVYTAQFTENINTYTITWKNWDGEVLKTENLPFGSTPSYDGEEPVKQADSQYTYQFTGWSPEVVSVKADAEYTAVFSETLRSYNITWNNEDGTQITVESYNYGDTPSFKGEEPQKADTEKFTYQFTGWSPEIATVTNDASYTAVFEETIRTFNIEWVVEGSSVFSTVNYGDVPVYEGETPTKPGTDTCDYEFDGWSPTLVAATSDAVYTAQFKEVPKTYTVTWLNANGSVLKTDTHVEYGSTVTFDGTPSMAPTAEFEFEFAGWSPEVAAITADTTYTAQYNTKTRQYQVQWCNDDGTVLKTDVVDYNTIPVYTGEEPVKLPDAQYIYTFAGWTPAVSNVVANTVYTASYSKTLQTYTVHWVNEDGVELETDYNVSYGDVPQYNGATPTKPSIEGINYVFAGWNPTVVSVTGEIWYYATFTEERETYTITFNNENGEYLYSEVFAYGDMPVYNGAIPEKQPTAAETFTFADWSPALTVVTGPATYVATFSSAPRMYTINWYNWDNSLLSSQSVAYDTTPVYNGETPTRPSSEMYHFTFDTWSPVVQSVKGDMDYFATFTTSPRYYTVVWKNYNGDVLLTKQDCMYGDDMPTYTGSAPVKPSDAQYTYTFTGWSPEVATVTADTELTAVFKEELNTYTVTWLDVNGDVLEVDENVPYGEMPEFNGTMPDYSTESTIAVSSWDKEINAVTADATYQIKLDISPRMFTILFKNWNGDVLQSSSVEYGTMPEFTGSAPARESDAQYAYVFAGWSPEITEAKANAEYVAQFDAEKLSYTITWKDWDGTVLETQTLYYGDMPSFTKELPERVADKENIYTFSKWSPAIEAVSKNITYTAEYTATKQKYTIKWLNEDGSLLQSSEFEYGSVPAYTGTTPVKAKTDKYEYTFTGWTPDIRAVDGETSYTAVFKQTEIKPVTPSNPDGTVNPTDGGKVSPDKPATPDNATGKTPPTGDTNNVALWIFLMCIAALAMGYGIKKLVSKKD